MLSRLLLYGVSLFSSVGVWRALLFALIALLLTPILLIEFGKALDAEKLSCQKKILEAGCQNNMRLAIARVEMARKIRITGSILTLLY
jgi:hypothetical protein